jgi:hypothetical protein
VDRIARDQTIYDDRLCLLAEIDILIDLMEAEMRVLAAKEQRLSEAVFKTVPQKAADASATEPEQEQQS